MKNTEKLPNLLRRLAASYHKPASFPTVDLAPCSPFGAVLEERVKILDRDLREVRSRVNGLIFLTLGAVVTQVLLRLFG